MFTTFDIIYATTNLICVDYPCMVTVTYNDNQESVSLYAKNELHLKEAWKTYCKNNNVNTESVNKIEKTE